MTRVTDYLKETKAEMSHVSWPTKKQVWYFTALVVGISLFTAAYLGLFDALFAYLLETFVL
ncbi:MAG: preprotein translocase subunit SecE [Parcubacteria group bacterium]|nr:preprotein translocase subunit SecE [Parcubacteria group bacterium]